MEETLQLPYPSFAMWEKRMQRWGDDFKNLVAVVDGKVVGQLGLQLFTRARRKHVATFGMVVCASVLRRGVGSALLEAAIDACDNWMNVSRIELQVYVDNEPAIALYQKFGFEIEGTHKQFAFKNNRYVDAHTMARVRQ